MIKHDGIFYLTVSLPVYRTGFPVVSNGPSSRTTRTKNYIIFATCYSIAGGLLAQTSVRVKFPVQTAIMPGQNCLGVFPFPRARPSISLSFSLAYLFRRFLGVTEAESVLVRGPGASTSCAGAPHARSVDGLEMEFVHVGSADCA